MGAGYDPALLEEQEPLVGEDSQPPSPPRAPLEISPSLQRAHTAHVVALSAARPGDYNYDTSFPDTHGTPLCALLPHWGM